MSIRQEVICLTRDDLTHFEQLAEWRAAAIDRRSKADGQPTQSQIDAATYNRKMARKIRKLRIHLQQEGQQALEFINYTDSALEVVQ
ncbi:MAG: hypothetical protein ABNH42_19695 [Marinobacter sp.]